MKNILILFVFSALALVGCNRNSGGSPQSGSQARVKVGIVLDKGGKDDKSFNTAAIKGGQLASDEFKSELEVRDVECPDDAAYEPAMRTFAERGYNLIVVVGFNQADALKKVAPQFPKTHFAIIDSNIPGPNVSSLMFNEHEGSFLVGAAAAAKSKTGVIGFVGGMDVDLIRRFEMGYKEGAAWVNPKIKVISNFAGVTSDAWANPNKGKELALAQYGQKADVIFAAAGATNLGVFDAAEAKKLYAIGVDSNQNWMKPGLILTSMLKRVDQAVLQTIRDEMAGKFSAGLRNFGIQDGGISYAMDEYNSKVMTPEVVSKVEEAKKQILAGQIKVTDYYIVKGKK